MTQAKQPGAEALEIQNEQAQGFKGQARHMAEEFDQMMVALFKANKVADRADLADIVSMGTAIAAATEAARRIAGRPLSSPPRL